MNAVFSVSQLPAMTKQGEGNPPQAFQACKSRPGLLQGYVHRKGLPVHPSCRRDGCLSFEPSLGYNGIPARCDDLPPGGSSGGVQTSHKRRPPLLIASQGSNSGAWRPVCVHLRENEKCGSTNAQYQKPLQTMTHRT